MKISTSTLNFSFSYIFYWQINISLPFWWDFLYSVFVNRNFWPGTIYYVCKLFGKSNILTPWYAHLLCGASKGFMKAYKVFIKPFEAPQRCAYQAVRNVRFSKKLASALNEWFSFLELYFWRTIKVLADSGFVTKHIYPNFSR